MRTSKNIYVCVQVTVFISTFSASLLSNLAVG